MYKELFKLDDEFTIEADTLGFSLKRTFMDTKVWRRTGKKVTKEHEDRWFHPTIAGLLKIYVRESNKQIKSLDQYFEKLTQIQKTIDTFKRTYIIEERPVKLIG